MLHGQLLDGRGLQFHAPAGGAVGLGQHQGHLETRGEQALERDTREFRRAGKDDFHEDWSNGAVPRAVREPPRGALRGG